MGVGDLVQRHDRVHSGRQLAGRVAGVEVTAVRYEGVFHDFMMLNPLSGTRATRAAVAQAISIPRKALHDA